MESDLIPYSACTALLAHAALVLAPHPDDEVFGCGGAIASHVKHGHPVYVVVLTDGALYGDTAVRQLESEAASAVLGYGLPEFWGYPDRGLVYSEALVQRLASKIATTGSDLVYAPSPWEIHPDHRQTHMLAVEAVRRCAPGVRLAFYEIGSPLRPNVLLDLTPWLATKEAAMRCFGSQLQQQDYVGHIQALNRFRSYTLSQEVLAAEAYWVLTASELDRTWRAGWQTMVSPGRQADTVTAGHPDPLVSVLVRSVDGRFLPEALDSLALQVYPNIEVVVAHAGMVWLPAKCGPFSLRSLVCDGTWNTAQTSNHLMAHARGEFLLFLDEDDWLLPEHVARLCSTLTRQPHTLAVFTGVRVAQQAGWPTGEIHEFPFDGMEAMEVTAVPAHAVLFSHKLCELNGRFDEDASKTADWDFWKNISRQTFFVKLPGASAVHRNREGRALLRMVVAAQTPSMPVGRAAEVACVAPAVAALSGVQQKTAVPALIFKSLATVSKSKTMITSLSQRDQSIHRGGVMVSVLIRTMNRASLAQAIISVAEQSFDSWEILVVNASGQPLEPLRNAVARQVTRTIEPGHPLDRSAAANALLDAASGRYAVFLDDDDMLLPSHLQKLVEVLEASDELVACYSDVQTIAASESASFQPHVYARDYDPMLLQLQNYLPVHSVMFRVEVARSPVACRFDEALPLFEDWDFWLQLAVKGLFRRVEGVSALYALNPSAGSGHVDTEGALRQATLLKFGTRQLERWGADGVVDLILWQGQQVQDRQQAQQTIDSLQTQLSQAAQDITRITHALDNATVRAAYLQAQLDSHEQSHLQAKREVDDLKKQRDQAIEDVESFKQQLTQAIEDVESFKEQLTQAVHEKDGLTQQLDHGKAAINDLQHTVQVLQVVASQHEQTGVALAQVLRSAHANEFAQHMELEKLGRIRLEHLHHINALNARLLATYQSHSWRLTRPLRGITRLLRWLKTPKPLRLVRNGLLAVRGEVRRHGVTGFARRLPHFLRHARTYVALLTSPLPEAKANAFSAQAPSVQALRLHPDLTDVTAPIDASISVVIPTYNAGTEFKWLLRKLMTQRGLENLEVVVVDSGSTDNTVLWAKEAGCRVVEITQAEFTHSHARNLGAANASSDYVLFMVQDAYPVGDYWAYGMLRYLLDHAGSGLVAASCSEYPRSDSDIMYDAMINVHYRFLGCHEQDRIGDFQGSDHMALRSRGQLSDVACLISRKMFGEYGYQGDYAEDLDLGIRLIKDGHKVAMLASVKVVHSHNRAAFYYLKRSYVDVIFLVGMFKDFTFPPVESVPGLLAGIVSGASHVSALLPSLEDAAPGLLLSDVLANWIAVCKVRCQVLKLDGVSTLGDARLDSYIDGLAQRLNAADLDSLARDQAQRFIDTFFARLEHFNTFAAAVYGPHDAGLREALQHVVRKTFAASAGSALGFMYMDKLSSPGADQPMVDTINQELRVGV